jgi:hypothetical protein
MRRGDEAIVALGSVYERTVDARSDCQHKQTLKQSDVDREERKYQTHLRWHGISSHEFRLQTCGLTLVKVVTWWKGDPRTEDVNKGINRIKERRRSKGTASQKMAQMGAMENTENSRVGGVGEVR